MNHLQKGFIKATLVVFILVILAGGLYLYSKNIGSTSTDETPTPTVTPAPTNTIPYGNVTLKVGESVEFKNNSLKLIRIVDDSRCATGVTCIWAGTLHAEILLDKSINKIIELGKSTTTESLKITLTTATPYPKASSPIEPSDYKLTFEVIEKAVTVKPTPATGTCFVGGCSGQICSDKADVVSTCEYTASYACYKTAKCERQMSGQCGWTETPELKMCLKNPPAL